MAKRGARSTSTRKTRSVRSVKSAKSAPSRSADLPVPFLIYIGFDPREVSAFAVSRASLLQTTSAAIDLRPLSLSSLQQQGLYTRPTVMKDGQLWDDVSQAPMSTEFAISRFFVPRLCNYQGWALFVDGDVLFRRDVADLLARADDQYAVMCVQHPPLLAEGIKKTGAFQQAYPRKNWSSVMLFNCAHPACRALDLLVLNTWPGRDLHGFRWAPDAAIGALPPEWNYLVGISHRSMDGTTGPIQDQIAIAHFTLGVPSIPEYAQCEFADEWWSYADPGRVSRRA